MMTEPRLRPGGGREANFSSRNMAPYKDALSNTIDRIDITQLDATGTTFAHRLMELVLREAQWELDFQADYFTEKKIKHLFFQGRNSLRLSGTTGLGIGFPLFVNRTENSVEVLPIFIWSLHVEPTTGKAGNWKLSNPLHSGPVINPYFLEILQQQYNFDGTAIIAPFLGRETIQPAEVVQLSNKLSKEFNWEESYDHIALCPGPEPKELTAAYGHHICWSAILGQFNGYGVQATGLWQEKDWPAAQKKEEAIEIPVLPLDPWQAAAFQATFTNNLTLVDGASGTGKTHFVLNYILNKLWNKETCLVISNNLGTLRELQEQLSNLHSSQYQFLVNNPEADKILLRELLRANKSNSADHAFPKDQFKLLFDKVKRERTKVGEAYQAVRKKVFGDYAWTETVGRFLKSNKLEGKELLSSQLNVQDFELNYKEYLTLKEAVKKSRPIYEKVNTLSHPLRNLNKNIFTGRSKSESLLFIENEIARFERKTGDLHQLFINRTDVYAEQLNSIYDRHYQALSKGITIVLEKITDFSNAYGEAFREQTKGSLKLYGLLSEKHRSILNARKEVISEALSLQQILHSRDYFDYEWTTVPEELSITELEEQVKGMEEALQRWKEKLGDKIGDEVNRLSSKSVNAFIPVKGKIEELELGLDGLLVELNDSGLYQQLHKNKMLTISKRQKYLEEIMEQLAATKFNLRDYDSFYDWQQYWLGMRYNTQKLVAALIKVKPHDWNAAFESWYLNNLLHHEAEAVIPSQAGPLEVLEQYSNHFHQLQPHIYAAIKANWQDRQVQSVKSLRKRNKKLYQKIFGKSASEETDFDLSVIFKDALPELTGIIPIIFMSTQHAQELLGGNLDAFDHIIFEDASFTPLYQVLPYLNNSATRVIVGNAKYISAIEGASLFEEAYNRGLRIFPLRELHQFHPISLDEIQYEESHNFPVVFEQVEGRFDEKEGRNEAEAQQVIRLLNQLKETPQRTFPSVAIVCLNYPQRNLIADYLLNIKQRGAPGVELIKRLERNGLGVFHIEEMAGLHFEVLIVSGTYGITDSKSTITEKIQWINSSGGTALLRLLMTRATQQLMIVNSIPFEQLEGMSRQKDRPGTYLLSNYFLMANAAADNKQALKNLVEEWMKNHPLDPPANWEPVSFREEVIKALQPYIAPGRIVLQNPGDVPAYVIVIKRMTATQPDILLWPDGFAGEAVWTDPLWETTQVKNWQAKEYVHYPIWSVNWWKNPSLEVRRIASVIIKFDEA